MSAALSSKATSSNYIAWMNKPSLYNLVDDWNQLIEEANSYSLFAEAIILTVLYDKKSIDAAGKKYLILFASDK